MSHPARGAIAQPDDGHFVMIPLTRGKYAIVDEADAEIVLGAGRWHAAEGTRTWYAYRWGHGMHNLIMGTKGVDHINHNGLDNRRINLRSATKSQNGMNQQLCSTNTSGYKGVSWYKRSGKWAARIGIGGTATYLGLFDDPLEAALAYNDAARAAFGEFAWLNPVSRADLAARDRPARRPVT